MRVLVLTKGFAATTVDQVCDGAEVTKGSFYHHFRSKEELGIAALHAYFDDIVTAFQAGDWASLDDPSARLAAFVRHASDVLTGPVTVHGCMLGSLSLDLAETAPEVRRLLASMFAELRDMVAELVAAAAADRGRELDAARLGDQFLAVLEGSIVLAKAHGDPAIRRHGMDLYGEHLALLLGEA